MNKPVIFLDVDGVFVTERYIREEYARTMKTQGRAFDPRCVAEFNRILREVDPDIVVSSTWRILHTLEELDAYFKEQGIVGARLIGRTPYGVKLGGQTTYRRGFEIQAYMNLLINKPEKI